MNTTLAGLVSELRAVTKNPYLVAIDGLSGAGKSTLSTVIASNVPAVSVVRKDDFYREVDSIERASLTPEEGYYRNFDWQRLERQVLKPLAARQAAAYDRYDWVSESLAETITVEPEGIVIVDGVGSTRPELRDYYDLRIWVETDDDERWQRQVDRAENSMHDLSRWAAAERYYMETIRPWERVDRILPGE